MTPLDIGWCSGALFAVATKYLDCHSTARLIERHGGHEGERNPIAKRLMDRFGSSPVLWGIFWLEVFVLAGSSLQWLWVRSWPVVPYLGVVGVWALGLTQGAVAHTNYTGRLNVFTRGLDRRRR